jgi:hypothetical protein
MLLRYLLDENLLGGSLWSAIQQHNAQGLYPLDARRVGDPSAPPKRTPDPDLLLWCEREARVLISLDKSTLPVHLAKHLQAGHHSPGVFIPRVAAPTHKVLEALVLAAYAGDPALYVDCITFIP